MIESRVLFVDDDILNHWLVTDSLTARGFIVTGVSRGDAAVKILDEGFEFDLLVTDLHMPDGMSGFELADYWRRIQPGRPIIYTGDFRDIEFSPLQDDEGFIPKHADAPDLIHLVDVMMHEARMSALPPLPHCAVTVH